MDIKNKSQFIEYFSEGIKSQNNLKIGVEHERFLFEGENKKRISFETLKKLFENLKFNGWKPLYEKENIIGMQRDNQQITTEPGLQCELSGAPLENIHQVCSESSKFLKEIEAASKGLNINTVSIGFDPFNNLSDIPQSPKNRYKIMTKEMPKVGKQSLEMMYRTCGIQINYDYTSEENFEKIFRLGNYLTPITIALYSNSPFESGKPVGYFSYRNKVWQNTSRGGIMPIAFEKVSFEKYFDHVIEYPILFAIRNKNYIEPNGQPFRDLILGNFSNLKDEANLQDFETHLATIFTEVRLKQFIEVRSLDACDWECLCDGPAFFTGIFYKGLDEAFEIAMKWKKENVMNAYFESPKKGLETELEGKKLHEWGNIFFGIAKRGLVERKHVNSKGNDETVYLKHVENVIKNKQSRAQLLLDQYKKTNNLDFFKNEKENFNYSGF
jgi:glutamate--cysteine ligase